ncbi:MAG: tRNA methyltransferase [Candidatus Aenigmarchaeota archaeon ex4484_56]|nr:MAG: tRNA methyltransferase [Candidatus Aenigmarchaeota archaeon ex4484_56]
MQKIFKKLKRGPQIILPKDCGMIVAYSGLSSNWNVLEAGTGSGFLTIFLARLVYPGKVVTYEKRKDFYELAKNNIKISKLDNIEIHNKDIIKAKIKEKFNLIVLDLKNPDKHIKKLDKYLLEDGIIVIYSPNIEQIKKSYDVLEKLEYEIKVIENIVRKWSVGKSTHPVSSGITHTGFLIFGEKINYV